MFTIKERHLTLGELFNLCQDIELRQAKLYASLSLRLGSVDERIARFLGADEVRRSGNTTFSWISGGLCALMPSELIRL